VLYWADGHALQVYSASVDIATGVARSPSTLRTLVDYVAIPTALLFEQRVFEGLPANRLYVLDQARPTKLTRLNLNVDATAAATATATTATNASNATITAASEVLISAGLSRPRALAHGADANFFVLVDSGSLT